MTIDELIEFDGWHQGLGSNVKQEVMTVLKEVYKHCNYFQGLKCDVIPLYEGDVLVNLSNGTANFVDLVINPNLTLETRVEQGMGANYDVLEESQNVDKDHFLSLIKKYLEYED